MSVAQDEGLLCRLDQAMQIIETIHGRLGRNPQALEQSQDHQRAHPLGWRRHVEGPAAGKVHAERLDNLGLLRLEIAEPQRAADLLQPGGVGARDIAGVIVLQTRLRQPLQHRRQRLVGHHLACLGDRPAA